MLQQIFVLNFLFIIINAKTYYFNKLKNNNEFRIYNRVNLSQSNFSPELNNSEIAELRSISITHRRNETFQTFNTLLDEEWNYNINLINKTELPLFIYKFYDSLLEETNPLLHTIRILFNSLPLNSTLIQFNLNSLSENVTEADFYFYFIPPENLLKQSLVLRLYQVENEVNDTSLNPDNEILLNVIYIQQAENGWQIFKIKNAVNNWLNVDNNFGLIVTISKPNENNVTIFGDHNEGNLTSFLLTKTIYGIRSTEENPKNVSLYCKKSDLYIDFKKLTWDRFIIRPEGYQASNCIGKCYKTDKILTNHVKILNSYPTYSKREICCVPIKYLPLPIMFYDKYGNVVVKLYEEMIVDQCGCR